jgi:hypothetical protein
VLVRSADARPTRYRITIISRATNPVVSTKKEVFVQPVFLARRLCTEGHRDGFSVCVKRIDQYVRAQYLEKVDIALQIRARRPSLLPSKAVRGNSVFLSLLNLSISLELLVRHSYLLQCMMCSLSPSTRPPRFLGPRLPKEVNDHSIDPVTDRRKVRTTPAGRSTSAREEALSRPRTGS